MKRVAGAVREEDRARALDWVMERSAHPSPDLEPDFDIADDVRRYAKKIRRLFWVDEPFWSGWLAASGLERVVHDTMRHPRLMRHAAFIKRARDESFIPLHQDIALWEKKYLTATTFWVALTDSRKDNGGMFYYPDDGRVYEHTLDLRFPTFKCIGDEETRVARERIVDADADAGDLLIWSARTAHGSHRNETGRLRVGMPFVFVEEEEFAGVV